MKTLTAYVLTLASLFAACTGNPDPRPKPVQDTLKQTVQEPLPPSPPPNPDTSYIEFVFKQYDLVNVKILDSSLQVQLKYADTSNFLKKNMYDGLRNAYLTCEAAIKLCNAQFFLKQENPDYALVVFDAARPLHVQQMMWDSVRMDTSLRKSYLAAPDQNSLHNYGCAVDIGIVDARNGKLLDMGTPFDFFGKLSQPAYEWVFLRDSTLSREAHSNRKLLRKVMMRAGYKPITSEWWHFSICNKEEAALRFKLIK